MDKFKIISTELVKYEGNDAMIEIPKNITSIGDFAFSDCSSIERVIIPDQVTSIGNFAFYGCENLEYVEIPNSVTLIGGGAFSWCPKLDGVVIPDSIRSISRSTFYKCTSLQDITLPQSIRSIEHSAFGLCKSLNKITLPDSLIQLGDSVFEGCEALRDVVLPKKLQSIGKKAFYGCFKLRSLVLPESVNKVDISAFETQGRISIIANETLEITPPMLDANWAVFITRKDANLYMLENSYLPKIELKKWKPVAQIVLLVNFLETYTMYEHLQDIEKYRIWCGEYKKEVLDFIFQNKRYAPLNQALETGIYNGVDIHPYFDTVTDREEKAKLMEYQKDESGKDDILSDLEAELLNMF